jgi:hypothetical protein
MARFKINVTVERDDAPTFRRAVQECRAAGMTVERELAGIGIITGEVDADQVATLEKVAGVKVERARAIQVKPPGRGPV